MKKPELDESVTCMLESEAEVGSETIEEGGLQGGASQITLSVKGSTPLMMNCGQLANPFDPYTQQLQQLVKESKRKGVDKIPIYIKMAEVEFKGGLNIEEDTLDDKGNVLHKGVGPFVSPEQFKTTIQTGATLSRGGKMVQRGIHIPTRLLPLLYTGPRSRNSLWAEPKYRDQRLVVISGKRILRTRPIFSEWALKDVPLIYFPAVIGLPDLIKFTRDAGMFAGIGEGRGKFNFGRFTITEINGNAVSEADINAIISGRKIAAIAA